MARNTKAAIGLLAGVAVLAVAIPAFGQQSPQSILPPGFGAPAKAPPSPPTQPQPPATTRNVEPREAPTPAVAPSAAGAGNEANLAEAATANVEIPETNAATEALRKQDLPEFARRSTDHVGFLSSAVTGVPLDGFGDTSGRFLATLMARLDVPVASRWVSMLLRRVLTTDIATPGGIDPADWVAERALLLARMGEADAARLLVQRIDPDRATPRFYEAVLESGMAAADPAALCPVANDADAKTKGMAWPLARAMCTGLTGEAGTASALVDRARSLPGAARGIDLLLAERIVGAGPNGRRATDVQWSGVNELTSWRFGLASAAGLAIPDNLFDNASLPMQAWRARAPMLPMAGRLPAERIAATLGVASSADLVDFVSALAEGGDPYAMDDTPAGRLRSAYAAHDESDRVVALRALWADPENEREQYASHILTARAAARIVPSSDYESDTANLLAAMLSAGLDTQTERWAGVVRGASGTTADEAWGLLAVGAPRLLVPIDDKRITNFGSGGRGSAKLRAQFLFVSLAALGRLQPRDVDKLAQSLDVPLGVRNSWTRAIDAATARREPATVALLAAVGMQTTDWSQVSPVFLYHIVASLRAVGFEPEARMVAAEALMRT